MLSKWGSIHAPNIRFPNSPDSNSWACLRRAVDVKEEEDMCPFYIEDSDDATEAYRKSLSWFGYTDYYNTERFPGIRYFSSLPELMVA